MSRTRNATLTRVSGLIVATGFYLLCLAAPAAADQRVSWMSMRNVAINGAVLYESQQQPRFPLAAALSLGTPGTTVRNVSMLNGTFNTSSYSQSGPYYDEGYAGPTFTVPATQRWTDTGIDIRAGDTITID